MGAKATFNATTKIITLTEAPVSGKVVIDVQVDLFSDAKEDWLSDTDLNKHRFLFRDTFGGQDLGGGIKAGAYYFMQNLDGWRIKPYEADHELIVNGNLYGVDPNSPIFIPTTGNFTVLMRLNTSSLTQQVLSGSGLSPEQDEILNLIKYQDQKVYINTENASNGDGSARDPFNNWTDAVDYSESAGITELVLFADATVDRQLKNFIITGIGDPTVDLNGQNVNRSNFSNVVLAGSYSGFIVSKHCTLADGLSGISGMFHHSGLDGDLTLANNAVVTFENPFSTIAGLDRPTISMGVSGTSSLSVRGMQGGLTILDCNNPSDKVTVEMAIGKLTIDSSCVGGLISARGSCQFEDLSNGTTVDTTALIAEQIWDSVL